MDYAMRTADQVKAGDALPELSIDVKPVTIVLGAMARLRPDRPAPSGQGLALIESH